MNSASDVAEPGYALGDATIQRKKDDLIPLITLLYAFMDKNERMSVSAAAKYLKRESGAEYKRILTKVGFGSLLGGLARAIRLFDVEFQVESGGYYFKKL